MSTEVAMATASTATSHPYTCNTCRIGYRATDLQKAHMRSDWHRYNLKRRVAGLPPITSETFSEKVLQAHAASNAEAEKAYFEKFCDACQKNYSSENSYNNHLLSSKHKQNYNSRLRAAAATPAAKPDTLEESTTASSTFSLGEPIKTETPVHDDEDDEKTVDKVAEAISKTAISEAPKEDAEMTEEPQASPLHTCLFCNFVSSDIDTNVLHMERTHGTIIPERPYLVDLPGLITHLYKRIKEDMACLVCLKVKSNAFAVQTHMRDTSHCMIPFTTEEEQLDIGDFYDFRSTYSDDEEDEDEMDLEEDAGAKLGAARSVKVTGEDGEEIIEDDGWETDSSMSSTDSDEIGAVKADNNLSRLNKHSHHSHDDPRAHRRADGYHSHAHKHPRAAFYDEFELHLPSGRSVGHRQHQRYYRQNLEHYPTPAERAQLKLLEDANANAEQESRGRDPRSRAVTTRNQMGITGIDSSERAALQKETNKHQWQQQKAIAKKDYVVGVKMNKQKNYFYRYVTGG
ncbi:Cytoplasmic 60S subunit biogenesis factor REI1 -like protein [Ceratocystis fimbriata CBS 114723]|uniref:Cytoplasmic 60S subunit biogenesis factor REI1-like protein n=1 Tax=Ceratocystis fimbriata CBS 114723 TaxID=1035309 RepID=A0A2C5X750_9PEZI|nr:Cytoplasmic 60S subunit biogenesis factor REI1 -like protein [Ceratocystis fimbriata CBS 114723]